MSHKSSALVEARRWASYAIAGAATAASVPEDAQAEIVYSGVINQNVAGLQISLSSATPLLVGFSGTYIDAGAPGTGRFSFLGIAPQAPGTLIMNRALSFYSTHRLSNLPYGAPLTPFYSSLNGRAGFLGGRFGGQGFFGEFGSGLAGMRFDVGQGTQFAWFRFRQDAVGSHYTLVDWAYGTPGQPLRAGEVVPEAGSLGLLALGAAGLLAWRAARRESHVNA